MFKFFGGKHRLAPRYPAPIHPIIVEPFAGGAAYSVLHRRAVDRVILIEKDERIVNVWIELLASSAESIRLMPDPVIGEFDDRLLVALAAGRTTRDTPRQFKVSPRMAQRFRPMVNRIAAVVDECRHFEIVHGTYSDAPEIVATWFVDPPYQATINGRWDRTRGGRYLHSNRDLDFDGLGSWTQQRAGQAIACDQEGSDWLPWNGRIEASDGTHRPYSEVWWTNTPVATTLF